MKIDNVTSAKTYDDHSIEVAITDPFDKTLLHTKRYTAIRGGLVWPTNQSPAYFCLLGQEFRPANSWERRIPVGQRVIIAEYASEDLSLCKFYQRMIDIADQFLCSHFYVAIPEKRDDCGFLNDFSVLVSESKSKIYLTNAFDVGDFLLGIARIRRSVDNGELTIPDDSLIQPQVQGITREDLQNSPEEVFFAINALRHVLGSYYRQPPLKIVPFRRTVSSGSRWAS